MDGGYLRADGNRKHRNFLRLDGFTSIHHFSWVCCLRPAQQQQQPPLFRIIVDISILQRIVLVTNSVYNSGLLRRASQSAIRSSFLFPQAPFLTLTR